MVAIECSTIVVRGLRVDARIGISLGHVDLPGSGGEGYTSDDVLRRCGISDILESRLGIAGTRWTEFA